MASEKPPAAEQSNGRHETEELTGTVEHIIYRSEDTGYTVSRVRARGHEEPVTVVCTAAAIWEGESLQARGKWVRHQRHGYQFQADDIVCLEPVTPEGIERYLSSGMIKGIRKELARRLVEKFGVDTLRIIEKESRKLEQVEGIGAHRRDLIKCSWDEQKAVRDIMIFLQSHGIGIAQAARIHREYGSDAIAVVKENPYRLARDIWGIGFTIADKVAMSLGIELESPVRARAGVLYVLQTMADDGHCFCPKEELIQSAEALLGISILVLEEALEAEIAAATLIADGDDVYLAQMYFAEKSVADSARRLILSEAKFKPIDVSKAVPWAEGRMELAFAPAQVLALEMAMSRKVSIITGGPGVGKTTIVKALVDVFGKRKLEVQLAAPTGRAAKRMEESTGQGAKTIHRLLKYQPNTGLFEYGPDNLLEGDIFIIDEVSMMDLQLAAVMLRAIPDHGCLILVGDVDQLPSVGPGNVLRDLIESGVIPAVRLDQIFRQAERSWIVHNAHRINAGDALETPDAGADADFFFIPADGPDQVIERLMDLMIKRIPGRFGFDTMTEVQVLTPMRRNQLGTINLNGVLQDALNPAGPSIERFGRCYRQGDRVIQIRNNYDKEVFNGDIGIIYRVDEQEQELVVKFEGRSVSYEIRECDELDLAYACTIHKSQGSEYPAVVLLMTTQHYKLLQRNLLYTGITRGRKLVCLVGQPKAIYMAIGNNDIVMRRTGLRERVRTLEE